MTLSRNQAALVEDHDRVNRLWTDGGPFVDAVRDLVDAYPERRGLMLEWDRLAAFDEPLANSVLNYHSHARDHFTQAFRECHGDRFGGDDGPAVFARLGSLPDRLTFRVGKQRAHHLGGLLALEGRVAQCGAVQTLARIAAFECPRSGHIQRVPQSFGSMVFPVECEVCEKHHGKSVWQFTRAESKIVDYREVVIEPAESNLDDPPQQFCALTNDLVDLVGPNDHVTVAGTYDTSNVQKSPDLDTYLYVWGIQNDGGGETDKLSPAELRDRVLDEVERLEPSNVGEGSGYGADRDQVVREVTASVTGVREQEVRDALDGLVDDQTLTDLGSGRVMQ